MVDFGQYKEKLVIQQPTETRKETGEQEVTWSDYKTVYGDISDKARLTTEEGTRRSKESEIEYKEVKLRYDKNITSDYRVKWDGGIYNILSVRDLTGGKRELRITMRAQ